MIESVVDFLEPFGGASSAVGGLTALLLLIWAILKWPFQRKPVTDLSPETINQLKSTRPEDGPALSTAQFIRIRRELKADLEAELAQAADEEKAQLTARIAELENQIANPDEALAAAKERIADLEALLEREGNEIAPDRVAEVRAALEAGDFSLADDLFAEIEARAETEVHRAARAALGRGEIVEAEIPWSDAAAHYARAAQLDPDFQRFRKAREFAWRTGDYTAAFRRGEDLVTRAKAGDSQTDVALALSDHASTIQAQGRIAEAEALYEQALEIWEATLPADHPNLQILRGNIDRLRAEIE